jgi:hypothetical protein
MGKPEKKKAAKKADAPVEKKAAKKAAEKPGTAKYEYPKDCTTDGDKKKYRSLMRAGKDWTGAGSGAKAPKKGKDHGPAKAVILDGKGKKIREEVVAPAKKKKKKSED